jgi:hypothetical protein
MGLTEPMSRLAAKAANLSRFLRVHGGESLFAVIAFARHTVALFRKG